MTATIEPTVKTSSRKKGLKLGEAAQLGLTPGQAAPLATERQEPLVGDGVWCFTCGFEAKEPCRHNGMGNLECPNPDWRPGRAPVPDYLQPKRKVDKVSAKPDQAEREKREDAAALKHAPIVAGAVIPLHLIRESPSNPRKVFNGLDELAESIRQKGLLQPVLVRPASDGRFEIIAGARRLRAARMAGLEELNAIVRDLDDAQVLECQVIENNQREDVHPLEEAVGFAQLRDVHGYSVETIAEKIGRSKGYVYQRIKLAELGEPGRDAFLAGKIIAATALLLARVPTAQQPEVLEKLAPPWRADPLGAREAARLMRSWNVFPDLDKAGFRLDDAWLVPDVGPCTTCDKRQGPPVQGVLPILQEEAEDTENLCTDPACFRKKCDAQFDRRAAEVKKAGGLVLDEVDEKKFRDLDAWEYVGNKGGRLRDLLLKATGGAPELSAITIARGEDGLPREYVSAKAADKMLARLQEPSKKPTAEPASSSTWEEARQARRELSEAIETKLGAAAERSRFDRKFWQIVGELAAVNNPRNDLAKAREIGRNASKLNDGKLRALIVVSLVQSIIDNCEGPDDPAVAQAAKAFGVDLDAVRREVSPPPADDPKNKGVAKKSPKAKKAGKGGE